MLSSLKKQLYQTLDSLCTPYQRFVYLDYPVHLNVGDLLIYAGTEHWIKEQGIPLQRRWCLDNFSFPQLDEDICILCHGGGNFGNLYSHQKFREKVVERYPRNPIIFLPQTVFFTDQESQQASLQHLAQHPQLSILFRDQRSLDIISKALPNATCILAPDMALALHPIKDLLSINHPADNSYLCLIREDIEASDVTPSTPQNCSWRGDWDALLGPWQLPSRLISRTLRMLSNVLPASAFAAIWQITAWRLIKHSAARFQLATHIRTSRMHGHIFATLLGIDNELLDNSYGKNSAYLQQWHSTSKLGQLISDSEHPTSKHPTQSITKTDK